MSLGNIFYQITHKGPQQTLNFLKSKGIVPQSLDHKSIAMGLADYVRKNGDNGIKQVAKLHASVNNPSPQKATQRFDGDGFESFDEVSADSSFANCAGNYQNCAGCAMLPLMAADAKPATTAAAPPTLWSQNNITIMVVSFAAILGLALIASMVAKKS